MIKNMTNEQAKEFIVQSVKSDVDIAKVADAIQTLEQQSSDGVEVIRMGKNTVKARQGRFVVYDVEWLKEHSNTTEAELYGQSSKDCISREQAIRATYGFERYTGIDETPYEYVESILRDLPSVTPTRPKGKWIILDECANEGVYCSECHKKVFKLEFSHTMKWRNFKYCPNCGARMEVNADEAND